MEGFHVFSRRETGFCRQAKHFELLCKKKLPLDGQNRRAKSSPQPVNLHGALHLMNPATAVQCCAKCLQILRYWCMKVYDKLYVLREAARKTLKSWLMNNPNWLSWLLQLKYLPSLGFCMEFYPEFGLL